MSKISVIAVAIILMSLLSGCFTPTTETTTEYDVPTGKVKVVTVKSKSFVESVKEGTQNKMVYIYDGSWLAGIVVTITSTEDFLPVFKILCGKQDKGYFSKPTTSEKMTKEEAEEIAEIIKSGRAGNITLSPISGLSTSSENSATSSSTTSTIVDAAKKMAGSSTTTSTDTTTSETK